MAGLAKRSFQVQKTTTECYGALRREFWLKQLLMGSQPGSVFRMSQMIKNMITLNFSFWGDENFSMVSYTEVKRDLTEPWSMSHAIQKYFYTCLFKLLPSFVLCTREGCRFAAGFHWCRWNNLRLLPPAPRSVCGFKGGSPSFALPVLLGKMTDLLWSIRAIP